MRKLIACLIILGLAGVAYGGMDADTIGVSATVIEFAEWDGTAIDIAVDIGSVDQTESGSDDAVLYMNANTTLTYSATVLTCAGPSNDTMEPSFKVERNSGCPMGDNDLADYVAQSNLAGKDTHLTKELGTGVISIKLYAQVTSAAARAQDAGEYTGTLTVTATW